MIPFTKRDKCLIITGAVGLVLTIASLVLALYGFPKIIENVLRQNIVLEEGNEAWDRFVELPIPVRFRVYFFDIQNPEDVLHKAKPELKEIGPFVYKQFRKKYNISVKGELVSYYQNQIYEFDREATPDHLSEEMTLNSVNALQLGMYQILEKSLVPLPFDLDAVLKEVFHDNNLMQKVVVGDLLFKGIDFCIPGKTKVETRIVCLLVMLLNFKMINYKENLEMSYSVLAFKNNTPDGLYTVNTGTEDLQKVGSIELWENKKYTSFWKGENSSCDTIEGLDSTVYPPYIKENQNFKVYATDICRSAALEYVGPSKYRDTDTFRYRMSPRIFYPEEGQDPEDSCFCIKQTKGVDGNDYCYLDGLMDVQSCLGIPAVISLPHFLHADPKYASFVKGLSPDKAKHDSDMDIQPYTGFPTRGGKRVQINLVLRKSTIFGEDVEPTKYLRPAVLPVIWLEEGVELNDEYYGILKSSLNLITGVNIGQWVFVGVAIILFAVPNAIVLISRMKAKNSKPTPA